MAYRENMMVQNFIYELNQIQNADIMGGFIFSR